MPDLSLLAVSLPARQPLSAGRPGCQELLANLQQGIHRVNEGQFLLPFVSVQRQQADGNAQARVAVALPKDIVRVGLPEFVKSN